MYYYINHLGGIYGCEDYRDDDDLYCEECGDSDVYLGEFDTEEEALDAYDDYYRL